MPKIMLNPAYKLPRKQAGISLVIIMLFLVIMTITGVYSAKLSIFGEASSRNALDQQAARQAAEAALRDAEKDILLPGGFRPAGALCARIDGFVDERPAKDKFGLFVSTCPRAQCGFEKTYYTKGNYQIAKQGDKENTTYAEPWWPTGKGGLWNDTFAEKPSVDKGVDQKCSFSGAAPYGTFTGAKSIVGVSQQPEYLIELARTGTNFYYRITARGFGYSPNTQVVLQTYYQTGR
jgi:type IV pilus assembly protein PilX